MCPELDRPNNGSVQYSNVVVGSMAEYSCDEGFLLIGVTTRVCQIDGIWSENAPSCQRGDIMVYNAVIYLHGFHDSVHCGARLN